MARHRRADLLTIARRAMVERGLDPDFPPAALREVGALDGPAADTSSTVGDLRHLLWCSIDNDDSRDLDQLTVAEELGEGAARIFVAIADVDALVPKASAVDRHAQHNTTSIYTAARVFPMLPERLSTDLTSLVPDEDRLAVVVDYVVERDGSVAASSIARARVRNHAKLAYDAVAAWLEGDRPMPEPLAAVSGLDAQLRLQDRIVGALRERRYENGALDLETIEARPVVRDGELIDLEHQRKNRARALIEDVMIAANGVTARYLAGRGFASIRRVIRSPERWDRIVAVAAGLGEQLPAAPDSRALERFLVKRRRADPLRFPDLSVTIVKLMGAGEYAVQRPGDDPAGHFGLAVRDYVHSTAPNRRYPDIVTQRLLKAALSAGERGSAAARDRRAAGVSPYTDGELEMLARHCTEQEDAANKVERQVRKSAAAMLLAPRLGEHFDAIVTGASPKGTWVRIMRPPVEGKVVHGWEGLEVGDAVRVRLVEVDVDRGFIDFVRA